ncbi:MAG: S9 family peptidase [Gemmatimonadota bacterium]|nr:MAG: S9 family peptidase [Gemmatimonadota bacterium]
MSPRIALTVCLVLASIASAPPLRAQGPEVPGPSFEDILSLPDIGNAVIAPDGRSIAYTVRTTDWDENRYDTEIWLVREGEEPFQFTRTRDGASTSPQWSPDGLWLAFTADRGDGRQIYLMRAAGGEAWALTEGEEGVGGFEWAPDGKRIAFTRTEERTKAEKQREEEYGAFAVEDAEYRMSHLWLVVVPDEPDAAEATQLTEGDDFTVSGFEWSPDGTRIAFDHRPDPLINSWMQADISVLDVESRAVTPLVATQGFDGGPIWSPDGRWIAYQSSGPDMGSAYYTNGRFYKIPAEGGEPTPIRVDLDEDPFMAAWTPRGIFLVAWERTNRRVYRVDPNSGKTEVVADAPDRIWGVDFTPDGGTVAFVGRTATTLDEVYRSRVDRWRPVRLTNMTEQVAEWELGTSEVISWQSEDGTTIEGVLHKPEGFDPSRTYPLLVIIHGGPTGIDYPTPVLSYVYPAHQWLAKGSLVLRPNYRGSAGYGEAFRSLNVRNLGVGDAWDVLSGVDHLVAQGIVDTTRMGAMGWSQGGYISAYLATTTDRFAAISVGAGISNWVTYYVNTDIHPFTRQYLKATPWEDVEVYAKTSPMTFITDASTPTLIQHGEFDRRVPIPNAYELYQGLQDMGVDTRLIVYKGFGHGITKPKERLAATWHNWQWFGKYVWGEEIELPLEVEEGKEEGPGT